MQNILILFVSFFLSSVSYAASNCIDESLRFNDPIAQDMSIIKCTLKQMPQLGQEKCLKVARALQYQANADDLRIACFESSDKSSVDTCQTAHSLIEDSEAADAFAWSCLRSFNLQMTATQCSRFASKMSSQVQETRVLYYCLNEIKKNASAKECESISRRLYPQDSLRDIQSYCRKK